MLFHEYLTFPANNWVDKQIDKLSSLLGGVEGIEIAFNIEFSCGDGKYLSDLENTQEESEYDGKVCTHWVPRFRDTNEPFKPNKQYRFTIKVSSDDEEVYFYINGEERSRRNND